VRRDVISISARHACPSRLRRLGGEHEDRRRLFVVTRSIVLMIPSQSYVGGQITLQTHSIKFDD
jgi:hypothetical protein